MVGGEKILYGHCSTKKHARESEEMTSTCTPSNVLVKIQRESRGIALLFL